MLSVTKTMSLLAGLTFLSIPVLIKPHNIETSSLSKLVTSSWYVFQD